MTRATTSGALLSPCRAYRYQLWRQWAATAPPFVVIGLNPSTADETFDDPTIRRCIGFAQREGCGSLVMLNLFAFRATDPARMREAGAAAVGPENDAHIIATVAQARQRFGYVVAAWGTQGAFLGRDVAVVKLLGDGDLWCLGVTKGGLPSHPLYLPGTAPLALYSLDPA